MTVQAEERAWRRGMANYVLATPGGSSPRAIGGRPGRIGRKPRLRGLTGRVVAARTLTGFYAALSGLRRTPGGASQARYRRRHENRTNGDLDMSREMSEWLEHVEKFANNPSPTNYLRLIASPKTQCAAHPGNVVMTNVTGQGRPYLLAPVHARLCAGD